MSDDEDNIKEDFDGLQDEPESIPDSNVEQFNNLLEKGRLSESSNNQLMTRYTIVDKNFNDEGNSEIIHQSNEISNSKNNIKNEELKEKKHNKKVDKSTINFINLKIILVGDVAVGKTSIVGRYINNSFSDDYKCTISAEQNTKIIKEDDNNSIRLNIWDTAGQEKFRALTRQYYHDCQGAIIVFDITKRKTFKSLDVWINEIKEFGNKDTVTIIIGNKSDLAEEREITMNEIQNKLNDEYLYFEVSAKSGNNISLAFDKMKKLIMENKKKNEELEIINDEKNGKKSKSKKKKEEKKTKLLKEFDHQNNKRCC